MSNAQKAIETLKAAGYEAISHASNTVLVQDPIKCSSGKDEWIEYREVSLNVGDGLSRVNRFIDARS
jgi:hypothetical protein